MRRARQKTPAPSTPAASPVVSKERAPAAISQAEATISARNAQAAQTPRAKWTKEQSEQQLTWIEAGIIKGLSERQMQGAILRTHGQRLSLTRIRTLKARVTEAWKLEGERTRPLSKQAQLRRLYEHLDSARGKKDKDGRFIEKPNHAAIGRYEQLIAEVEGNFDPIKIDVDIVHREALMEVLGNMTEQNMAALVAAYDEMHTLAQEAAQQQNRPLPQLLPPATVITLPKAG